MPAKDIFHNAVRSALEKEGWVITQDPLYIKVGIAEFYIDLGAEKLIAAEKSGQQIAVEIKSFLGDSFISEFHLALGQTLNYRKALEKRQPQRILYLAVPVDTYDTFFTDEFIKDVISTYQVNLLIFSPAKEEIVQWKN